MYLNIFTEANARMPLTTDTVVERHNVRANVSQSRTINLYEHRVCAQLLEFAVLWLGQNCLASIRGLKHHREHTTFNRGTWSLLCSRPE